MTDRFLPDKIRNRLRVTWNVFFRRWGTLTDVQINTIPFVMKKKNAIIISSTASGKTEAILAPLCELLREERWDPISILYITPTRALVNDIYERIYEPLLSIAIKAEKKTGDSPYLNWKKPPDILITTPESLDSMICRHPHELNSVRAVVIDELHILDGNYRGDQLRVLLKRLEKIVLNFQIYGLSATISDPHGVAERYIPDCNVVQVGGSRQIVPSCAASLENVFEMTRKENLKKILIFCNSRRKTEEIAVNAKQLWGKNIVVVHHGSLHRNEREESEQVMKTQSRVVCVATMTLEIGIDIGSIDAVVLAEIPHTVSSFIQRIGRAGRRSGVIRIFCISDPAEWDLYNIMITAARENLLDHKEYIPDISVGIQQIFSLLFAHPTGIKIAELRSLLTDLCSPTNLEEYILPHLSQLEWIELYDDKAFATEKLMNLGQKGKIHSNIPDTRAFSVKNSITHKLIGEVELPETVKKQTAFVLSGKVWEIVKVEKRTIYVKPSPGKGVPASFKRIYDYGAFYYFLPDRFQNN